MCQYLGLPDVDIETIAYRYSGARERCYHSLMRWTQVAGHQLGVNALLDVLRGSNSHKLAGRLSTTFSQGLLAVEIVVTTLNITMDMQYLV